MKETEKERFENLQQLNRNFFRFSLLIIIRSIFQLGYKSSGNDFCIHSEDESVFHSTLYPWAVIKIKTDAVREIINIYINEKEYEFISMLEYTESCNVFYEDRIFLHYSGDSSVSRDSDNQVFISPEDAESTEKISRWIRKKILKEIIHRFPVSVEVNGNLLKEFLPKMKGLELNPKSILIHEILDCNYLKQSVKKSINKMNSSGKNKEADRLK
ncbi:MAG TPA: hypothetical protein PKV80_28475, partial [Leptospiraceae bacterium]|nr:hypothetical protein [Leptospiraceae bacterium]